MKEMGHFGIAEEFVKLRKTSLLFSLLLLDGRDYNICR